MIDCFHLPPDTRCVERQFYVGTIGITLATGPTPAYTWIKPRGISTVQIICAGGGGGGGAGQQGGSAGGGGGAAGGAMVTTIAAFAVPDVLYIYPGRGGTPGNNTTVAGGTGISSYVTIAPIAVSTSNGAYMIASGIGGGGGAAGAGGTAGGGGATSGATTVTTGAMTTAALQYFGYTASATNLHLGSQAGQTGSAGGVPTSLNYPATGVFLSGGGGGGGTGSVGNAGGSITLGIAAAGYLFNFNNPATVLGGLAGGSATSNGGNGSNGYQLFPNMPRYVGGGGGAGSGNSSGIGGNGGVGAYGCGGGGGGAGQTTRGNGGEGGAGFVQITCW